MNHDRTREDEESPPRIEPEAPCRESGSTLLPMLVGGLVLIVIGAVIVMTFV